MRRTSLYVMTLALVLGFAVATSHAAFIDIGGGMIYDTDLNITWLKDANYAQTSGYDPDGLMTSSAANTWATTLVYGGTGGWRLPTFDPSNPRPDTPTSLNEIGSLRTRLNSNGGNLAYPDDFSPFVNIVYLSLPLPPSTFESSHYWTGLNNGSGGLWQYYLECG